MPSEDNLDKLIKAPVAALAEFLRKAALDELKPGGADADALAALLRRTTRPGRKDIASDEPPVVLRRPAAQAYTGLANTAFAELVARGDFPAPIKLSDHGRACAWLRSECEEWLALRIARRNQEAAARRAAQDPPPPRRRPGRPRKVRIG